MLAQVLPHDVKKAIVSSEAVSHAPGGLAIWRAAAMCRGERWRSISSGSSDARRSNFCARNVSIRPGAGCYRRRPARA